MDPAYISAISALAGSVIGGLTTGFTTLVSQRSQARAGMVAHDLARREDLVRDFIIAASKTYGDAISNNEPRCRRSWISTPWSTGCGSWV
jgi:hypothetical protein